MDQGERSDVWAAFEEVAPNLCYINGTREALADLVDAADDLGELLEALGERMEKSDNPSFRTDLKILRGRLRKGREG